MITYQIIVSSNRAVITAQAFVIEYHSPSAIVLLRNVESAPAGLVYESHYWPPRLE